MTQKNDEHVAPLEVADQDTAALAAVAEPAAEGSPQQPEPYEMRHVRMHLRYNYTSAEKLEIAEKATEAHRQITAIEDEKKRANTQFKSRLEMASAERDEMMERIQTGYEMREIVCTVTANSPEPGMKTIRRSDTGDIVKIERMTFEERQMSLPGIPADDAATAAPTAVADGGEDPEEAADFDDEDDTEQPVMEVCDDIAVVVEKPEPKPRRKASRMGVVAVPSDGDDFDDPEFNKADY